MRVPTAKRIATRMNCELWYDASTQLWDLRRVTDKAISIEASGGMYMSPGQLECLTRETFIRFCQSALDGPDA